MNVDVSQLEQLRGEIEGLRGQLEALQARLDEPEEIVRAIREGEVDAIVVTDALGERVYSLRSADVLYRAMVEQMREGAIALDASGLIIYCNATFASFLKRDRAILIGGSIYEFLADGGREFFELDRPEGETRRGEIVLRDRDGGLVPVQATVNRMSIEGTPIDGVILMDLSHERRSEQLAIEGRRKDEFLAMLAHELRNPIAPIRNAVQVLHVTDTSSADVRWARDMIDRQVTHLSRLVDDLLDVSRITRGKIRLDLEPTELGQVAQRGIETVRPLVDERDHELHVELGSRGLWALADESRMAQVVSNLVHNAAKFTPKGGHITVRIEEVGADARIIVRDDGEGIPPEILGTIFEVFTQADATLERSQGGLGIGLALVRSIVEMHGGRVEAHSEGRGRGSEFVVTLPMLAIPPEEAERPRNAPLLRGEAPRRRVMVVDDNVDAAESLMALLEHMGHEVRMVTSGRDVVDQARDFRPEVVLLDIGLPDINGYELASRLRAMSELSGTLLVALTGYSQPEHRKRSREAGFDHHWVKPLDIAALRRLLSSPASG